MDGRYMSTRFDYRGIPPGIRENGTNAWKEVRKSGYERIS